MQLLLPVEGSSVISGVTTELYVGPVEILPRPRRDKRFVFFKTRREILGPTVSYPMGTRRCLPGGGGKITRRGVDI